MDYRLSIHGKNFYKEIMLTKDWAKGLAVGTTKECQMRFSKESFQTEFVIRIQSQNGQWSAQSDANVYLKKQDKQQEDMIYLMPLDVITICDKKDDAELFCMEFSIDFVNKTNDFDRIISCEGRSELTIGGLKGCTIRVKDPVLSGDSIKLVRENKRWIVDARNARYGIQINGFPCRNKQLELQERDMITINGCSFYWSKEQLYTSMETEIETSLPMDKKLWQKNHLQYPKFVKSARQQFVIPKEKIDILSPKSKPEEPKKNLVMTMVPMLVSMGLMVMMRMSMGGNIMFVVMCIAMGGVSVVMGIINYRNEGVQYRKNVVKRENDYNRYIAGQEEKIQELREKERIISRQKYPSVEEELSYVEDFDARLFEKQKTHEDYLFVRLGEGTVPSKCEIGYKEQEYREVDDPLMDYPAKLHEKYTYIEDMPVMLDLTKANAVGFLGDRTHLYQMTKNLILQFCIEHYYQDVKLYLLMGREDKQYFEWARWFRNFREENGMRNFVYDDDSSKTMLEYLYAQLSEREKMKEKDIKEMPTNIVFVYRSELLGEHPVSNYLERASELGFVFLFFEEFAEKVNPYCSKRIFLDKNEYTGYVQDIMDGEQIQHFKYSRVPIEKAEQAALKMACVYVDEVSLEASLTKNITLYQLLGIMNVYDLDLTQRWNNSRIYDTMAAPLGVKSGDEIVYLDLHEKYHGPHGLVAGTTGSGKSEILQAYILSMATLFHPYEVGFIIIDFKGGGMVNQFRNLPHLNGAITNIDGKEINRSLSSIKAELRKRQRLFAEYEVNHINDYIRLYKQGVTKQPLPHLILIVDEFAELKSEQPEFMKELISAARIGRSLGVHLILSTQKPSGVVNEQIWSNSKFKLCLKVQNQSDSNEVIKSPLAAEIREPGRAYLQVGNNEIFQLFQSAYSGAPVPNGAMGEAKRFRISKVELSGRREIIFEQKPTEEKGGETQLDAIVDYVEEYCKRNHIERLPDICLPPLPEVLPYTMEGYESTGTDICVPIGMYDDPENQYQGIMDVNFSQGHVFVIGSSQYGKTNLLQTMIRGIVEKYSSSRVHIYILDFASMIMKKFSSLRHVGGVISITETDKMKKFMEMMTEELHNRRNKLSELGLSSYSAYLEAGETEMSQIIIMLDNMAAFKENYISYESELLKLAQDGAAVGICLVITAQQTGNLGYKYVPYFPQKIAMYCNSSGEYSAMFERCKLAPDAIPGRCIFNKDKESYEGQSYLAFPAEKEMERVKEIQTLVDTVNANDNGNGARRIPVMPEIVTKEVLREYLSGERTAYAIPLGINYNTMEVDEINLITCPIMGMTGERDKGIISYIRYLLNELLYYQAQEPSHIVIIDGEEEELRSYRGKTEYYKSTKEAVELVFKQLKHEMNIRSQLEKKGEEINRPLECIVINSQQACKLVDSQPKILELCEKIVTEYRNLKVILILSDIPNEPLEIKSTSLSQILRYNKNLLIFRDLRQQKVTEIAPQNLQKYQGEIHTGDVFCSFGTYFAKLKTPNIG